jgi:hypothetical protein
MAPGCSLVTWRRKPCSLTRPEYVDTKSCGNVVWYAVLRNCCCLLLEVAFSLHPSQLLVPYLIMTILLASQEEYSMELVGVNSL